MIDEARARGVDIDTAGLAAELGIPVIEAVATEGRGLAELREALTEAAPLDGGIAAGVTHLQWADEMAHRFRTIGPMSLGRFQEWLGRAVREPLTGLPILCLVLYLTYLFVGVFGAQTLVGALEEGLFNGIINPAAIAAAARIPFP